ncbi:MAG: hypothetical protein RIS82_35 [Actinomycetota bacterium]
MSEQRLAKLRPRASQMFLPTLVLGLASAALTVFAGRLTEQWQNTLVWAVVGVLVLIFWLIPLLRYLSTYLEVTTARVIIRSGLMGQHRREIRLSNIRDVEVGKGRTISLILDDQDVVEIRGVPRHKMVALEIDRLAASI